MRPVFDAAAFMESVEDFVDIPALEQMPDIVAAASAAHIRQKVEEMASLELNSTAATYVGQIGPITVEDGVASIAFPLAPDSSEGQLALRLEEGGDSFSIKDTMLQGRPWRDVPLGRDDDTSAAITRRQGVGREFDPRTLGRTLKSRTKKLKVGETLNLPDVAENSVEARTLQQRYQGLQRLDRRDRETRQRIGSKYATFRRMSNAPGSAEWIYPATQGHFFFDRALEDLDPYIEDFVQDLLDGMSTGAAKSAFTRRARSA